MSELKIEEIRSRLAAEPIHRLMSITREGDNVDQANRTVRIALVSDAPVDHYMGPLILTTKKKSVRTARMDQGLALLQNHDRCEQIGIIENFSFDSDGIIRGDARFSKSEEGEEVFQDVIDGIKRFTSVGLNIYEIHVDSEKNGVITYRSDDWEPFEGSIVSVPADISVGVGRSMDAANQVPDPPSPEKRAIKTTENTMTPEEIAAAAAAEEAKRTATPAVETRSAEQIAVAEIREWAAELKVDEIATTYLRDCKLAETPVAPTKDGFFAAVRAAKPAPVIVPRENPQDQAFRQGGTDAPGTELATIAYRGGALKSYKGEKHLERAHRAGMFLLATLGGNSRARAFCEEKGLIRAHSGEYNSTGGVLVPDEFDQTLIDLRIQYGAFRRNANVTPMASDTKVQPRRTGGLTPYFTGGGDAATESTKSWDSITLVAKKLSVLTKYENELSEDAVINIADDLASEIAYAFAKKEDECGFNGTGASTYGGIVGVTQKLLGLSATRANISGLQVASGNAWAEIVIGDIQGVVAKLPQFARQSGNVKWYCSHEFYATVLMRLAQAVGGVTATEIQNGFGPSFFGIPVEIVEVMPHTEANDTVCLLYGNLSQAATLGDRRGTTIAMSNSDGTDFAKGIMAIRGDTRFDINVHDVGNATATAADKTPGPIVGLLTAAS